jgi:hypothetical protein
MKPKDIAYKQGWAYMNQPFRLSHIKFNYKRFDYFMALHKAIKKRK